jgi:succinate-acetate transporter protein
MQIMATIAGSQGFPAPGQQAVGAPGTVPTEMGQATMVAIGDPAPLGLGAFGITTLCLSAINAGWIGAAATTAVLALAIPFGGVAQGLAGMWAFRRGNTFAGTAFTSYGAFWISYFLLVNFFAVPVAKAGGAGELHQFLGLYLFVWGIFTLYMTIASLGAARAVQLVFVLLTVTFFLLCAGEWAGSETWAHIGGYVGVATAVAALYASFADVTNATLKRTVLPT